MVSHGKPLPHRVRDHHDRGAASRESTHERPQPIATKGIKPGRGLVKHIGPVAKRDQTSKFDATPLSTRERERRSAEKIVSQPHLVCRPGDGSDHLRLSETDVSRSEGDVIRNGIGKELRLRSLECQAHATRPYGYAIEKRRAVIRVDDPRERTSRRRLTRPGETRNERDRLQRCKRHRIERPNAPIGNGGRLKCKLMCSEEMRASLMGRRSFALGATAMTSPAFTL